MGIFGEGLFLGVGEGWGGLGFLGKRIQFAVVFLDLLLAQDVDDFGGW